jgi:hypothetical protein
MKRKFAILFAAILFTGISFAQKLCTMEGVDKIFTFGHMDGKLETDCVNPKSSTIHNGQKCIKYTRSTNQYDNVKIHTTGKLKNVPQYAVWESNQKLKLKLYSTAPAGTLVEIQFAKKGIDNFPKGVHSQFQTKTSKQNDWEELTFEFVNYPEGSQVAPEEIDEIILLFSPNSSKGSVFYFYELTGPLLEQ